MCVYVCVLREKERNREKEYCVCVREKERHIILYCSFQNVFATVFCQ